MTVRERRALLRLLGVTPLTGHTAAAAVAAPAERPDWSRHFEAAQATGSILVADDRTAANAVWVRGLARAQRRFSPASTFKIPHSLFALDAGLLKDAFQVLPRDGMKRPTAAWSSEQTLRSAMRHSVVWVYQGFASALGTEREAAYMRSIDYGNALATAADPFWVEWPERPVSFALNIDTPNRLDDLPKREAITRDVLQSLDALPRG